ncbi:hypothetical protein Fleli_4013 [Bernardetia litoralis DSM 6794]|uniref:Gram-negative bacterial tonB protein n=1 Tax=Bernardetia litoralis (strain ATCC 23117 / DSM 6794 / NBRC 15988 / NCIMB 1366 / Fx l1 / Sio-4) TaxID=880071 RepID=I4AQS8_BERLS|nr:hypothetical protein [Bernardetia litoralis]AFM06313.1 hypothetical protein Fleli_4013 [Bernardetia litoralis DSM 6794]
MKNQDIQFNKKTISSEKIKSYQNFDALLNEVENNNSNEKTKIVFISFSNPYFSVAASICLLCIIGMGLFLVQNNTDSKLTENSIEEKTDLAYSITSKDLETAERLTAAISQKIDLPNPKNGTAITTTILEENASPENASLEQVAQVLRTEMNKENSCKLTTSSPKQTKYIAFVVSSEGQITDIEAQGCEQEAKKVLNSFPKWKAGTLQGQHLSQRVVVAI